MSKAPLKDRIRYAFDNSLSRGTVPFIGWLALASAILVLFASLVIWVFRLLPATFSARDRIIILAQA